jgi:cystathionine gamma-synthase/methionine-gamma-lyase
VSTKDRSRSSRHDFSTRAVHAGRPRERFEAARPTVGGIHASTTYSYGDADTLDAIFGGQQQGFVYGRHGSPTVEALERAMADLEGGEGAVAFASGMGAVAAAFQASLASAAPGAGLAVAAEVYGATRTLAQGLLGPLGVPTVVVDSRDPAEVEARLDTLPQVAVVHVEAITNPLVRLPDLPRLAEVAHRRGALLAVDATFATPYLLRPLEQGADLVVHSATKFLGGHGDATLGLVIAGGPRASALLLQLRRVAKLAGAVASPFDAFLVHRGLRTLPLRVGRQSETALALARRLRGHPRVARVHYPGLDEHPDFARAADLLGGRGAGGVLAFELRDGDAAAARRYLDALELCVAATSLGDVESLVLVPVMSSHRDVPVEERRRLGIVDGLVRLSVGLEHPDDLWSDLEQALDRS